MMTRGRSVGYVRASIESLDTVNQLDGLALDMVFIDESSGKDSTHPALAALLDYLRPWDTLYVHSMSRLGRNLGELCDLMEALINRSISVMFVKDGLAFSSTASSTVKFMLAMMGAVVEAESEMTRERQAEGIARARSRGAYRGRRQPKLSSDQLAKARSQIEAGMQKSLVARELHVSRTTLYMHLKKPAGTRARRG